MLRLIAAISFCLVLFTSLSSDLFAKNPVVKPGGKVRLTVGQVSTTALWGRPLWKAENIEVRPKPLSLPNGSTLTWAVTEIDYDHSHNDVYVEKDLSDKTDLPDNEPSNVIVEFRLPQDGMLLGKTLSVDVDVIVSYLSCTAEERLDFTNGRHFRVNRPHLQTSRISASVSFDVSTAEQIKADEAGTVRLAACVFAGIVAVLGLLALILRIRSKPRGLTKSLNSWRAAQLARLSSNSIVCPACHGPVIMAPACSACGHPLLRGRVWSRILVLFVPSLLVLIVVTLLIHADVLFFGATALAASGIVGVVLAILIRKAVSSAFTEIGDEMKGMMSAILLPSSPREKHLRLANRISTDPLILNETKARMYALTLGQPFLALSQWHIKGDRSCGMTFWKSAQSAPDITDTTREVMNDLAFVECFQDCRSRRSHSANDPQMEYMLAVASDSEHLREALVTMRREVDVYGMMLLSNVTAKIADKAPGWAAMQNESAQASV